MVGEDRLELMVWVVDATLAVVPKGLGFVGVGVPKGPEELGGICGVVMEDWERWGQSGICRSPMRLLRRLPLDLWGRASRLVGVSVIDGLR